MSLTLVQVKPGVRYPVDALMKIMGGRPKMAVKFAAVLDLDPMQLSALLRLTCPDVDLVQALTMEGGTHSGYLQDYIVELGYDYLLGEGNVFEGEPEPEEDLLAEMFKQLEVKVADSILEVADLLTDTLVGMPGKQGRMEIKSLLKADRKIKGKLGVSEAQIVHARVPDNLVVFDTSGSMGEGTVSRIVEAVVAMAIEANAHLVIVSDTPRWWRPGEATVAAVLAEAEYGGTHYETLAPLFEQDWGVVVSIADYDSSLSAKEALSLCTGRIGLLLDISLVAGPTFLAECLDQLADETRPLLVARQSLTYDY